MAGTTWDGTRSSYVGHSFVNSIIYMYSACRLLYILWVCDVSVRPWMMVLYDGWSKGFEPNIGLLADAAAGNDTFIFQHSVTVTKNSNTLFILITHLLSGFQIHVSVLLIQPVLYSWLHFMGAGRWGQGGQPPTLEKSCPPWKYQLWFENVQAIVCQQKHRPSGEQLMCTVLQCSFKI